MDRDSDGYKRLRGLIAAMAVVMMAQGVALIVQNHNFNHRITTAQTTSNKCLLDNFTDLVASLKVRGELTQKDSDNTSSVILKIANAAAINDGPAVSRALAQYRVDAAKTKNIRANTPIPDFPKGTCDP